MVIFFPGKGKFLEDKSSKKDFENILALIHITFGTVKYNKT